MTEQDKNLKISIAISKDKPKENTNTELKEGDVVCLKSGSPKMTIIEITFNECRCVYFNGGELMKIKLYDYCLTKATE